MRAGWALVLLLVFSLAGCSWAGSKVETLLDRHAEKKVARAAEMAAERSVKIDAATARDVTLFTGTVTGPCRGLEVRVEQAAALDVQLGAVREKINAIYGARTLSDAEVVAGELQDLLPAIEKARAFGGIHGGCLLPVTVAGDPAGPDGAILPRKVLCPIGPTEERCKALAVPSVVAFSGSIVGADRVYYVPAGPEGLKGGG